jgi:hypothetical protein
MSERTCEDHVSSKYSTPVSVPTKRRSWRQAQIDGNAMLKLEREAGKTVKDFFKDRMKGKYVKIYSDFQQIPSSVPHVISHACSIVGGPLSMWGFGFSWFGVFASFMFGVNLFLKLWGIGKLYNDESSAPYRITRMISLDERELLRKRMEFERCCHPSGIWFIFTCIVPAYFGVIVCLFLQGLNWTSNAPGLAAFLVMNIGGSRYSMGNVSFHFIALCRTLTGCVENLTMWDDVETNITNNIESSGEVATTTTTTATTAAATDEEAPPPLLKRKVDLSSAFANYRIMVEVLEDFAASYANFFFFAEFGLFLAWISMIVATWQEVTVAIAVQSSSSSTLVDVVVSVLRVWVLSGMALMVGSLLFVLFWYAAGLTQAAQAVTARAHRMVAVVAVCGDEASIKKSLKFLDHVERGEKRIGFRGMGITISKSLILKSLYLVGTLASTGLLVFARYGMSARTQSL